MLNKNLAMIFILLISIFGISTCIYLSSKSASNVIPVKTGIRDDVLQPDPRIREDDNEKSGITNSTTTREKDNNTTPPPPPDLNIPATDERQNENNNHETLSIKMIVGNKTYETKMAPGSTAYDLMKKLSQTAGLQFSSREYSGLGQFVEEINGIRENKQKGIYWLLFINGKSAGIGISNYIIKPNDLISWKYDKTQF